MKNFVRMAIAGLCVIWLSGCASIVNGTKQNVSVDTGRVANASCSLQNSKGKWYINRTPGSTTVHRAYSDLQVKCTKRGYTTVNRTVKSKTKAMAFGNLVFGGLIGAGIDSVNGAAYDYPEQITVPMHKQGRNA